MNLKFGNLFLLLLSFSSLAQVESHQEFIESGSIFGAYINKVDTDNGDIYTYGLYLRYVDSITVKYELSVGKNWRDFKEYQGQSVLDQESIHSNHRKIKNLDSIIVPVYVFIDTKDDCSIEVLLSKEDNISATNVQIVKRCNDLIEEITSPMWYK